MNLNSLPDHARIWVYQSNKPLTREHLSKIDAVMTPFVNQWQAHGKELSAAYEVRSNRWLILGVDENAQEATGCSIDSSVHLIQKLGDEMEVDFFNRTLIVWENKGELVEDQMHDFWAKRKANIISDATTVFNTLAKNVGELKASWKVPFSESWHADMW